MASFLLAPPEFESIKVDFVDHAGEDGKLRILLRVFTAADMGRVEAKYGRDWLATIAGANDLKAAIEVFAQQIENPEEVLQHFPEEDSIVEGLCRVIPVGNEEVIGVMQTLARLYERAMVDSATKKKRIKRRRRMTGLKRLAFALLAVAAVAFLSNKHLL